VFVVIGMMGVGAVAIALEADGSCGDVVRLPDVAVEMSGAADPSACRERIKKPIPAITTNTATAAVIRAARRLRDGLGAGADRLVPALRGTSAMWAIVGAACVGAAAAVGECHMCPASLAVRRASTSSAHDW
jgi:hypothetical protein